MAKRLSFEECIDKKHLEEANENNFVRLMSPEGLRQYERFLQEKSNPYVMLCSTAFRHYKKWCIKNNIKENVSETVEDFIKEIMTNCPNIGFQTIGGAEHFVGARLKPEFFSDLD